LTLKGCPESSQVAET